MTNKLSVEYNGRVPRDDCITHMATQLELCTHAHKKRAPVIFGAPWGSVIGLLVSGVLKLIIAHPSHFLSLAPPNPNDRYKKRSL